MTRKFAPLAVNCSKAEELETLQAIAKVYPQGTYLADLFSARLFDWIESQLRDDVSPDLFALIDWQAEEANRDRQAKLNAESALSNERRTHAQELEKLTTEARNLAETLLHMTQWKDSIHEAFDNEYKRRVKAENRAVGLENEIGRLETELLKLKAKLFDFMTVPQAQPDKTPRALLEELYNLRGQINYDSNIWEEVSDYLDNSAPIEPDR